MNVVLCNRDPRAHIGGDAVQVYGYIKALKKLGHDAEYIWALDFNASRFDEAWLFHATFGWTVRQWRSVQNAGIPYRVFTIYYPGIYSDNNHVTTYEILKGAKAVYSLSNKEDREFHEEFPDIKTIIIDNGVDKDIFRPDGFKREEGKVLSVGRYGEGKGQLSVINACIKLNLPVLTIGSVGESDYMSKCFAMDNGNNVRCLGGLKNEEMPDYYRGAKVYVCASSDERNNLTVLEAAACGSTVIDTIYNRAAADHFFKIIDPKKSEELEAAILEAWNNPISHVDKIKSWDDIIRNILET